MFYPRFNLGYANDFLRDLRSLNNFASRFVDTSEWEQTSNQQVKVQLNDNGADLYINLPGYRQEQLDVETIRNVVTIRAKAEDSTTSDDLVQSEFGTKAFERSFKLPFAIAAGQTTASFEHGVLHLAFTKPESEQAKQIQISAS